MSRFWWRTWVVLRAVVLLFVGVCLFAVALGMFLASEHQHPKRQRDHQLFMADSIKVVALVDSSDVEPDSIEVYHSNQAFIGATVTLSTLAGEITKQFDTKVVRDENGDRETSGIMFPNPGRMRQGWTLDVVYWNSHKQVQFRSQRSGQRADLSLNLYISAAGRCPRLYLNYVDDPLGREMILLPAVGFQPSQAIAAI